MRLSQLFPSILEILDGIIIVGSVLLCCFLLMMRLPGMELLQISPDWLLIWLVVWSIKRTIIQGAIAGISLGLIHDGMSGVYPSHIFGFLLVGVLTAKLRKQQYLEENFISIALIVLAMVLLAETTIALQYCFHDVRAWREIWQTYQPIAIASAILTSLWAPVLYYPLDRWWEIKKQSAR